MFSCARSSSWKLSMTHTTRVGVGKKWRRVGSGPSLKNIQLPKWVSWRWVNYFKSVLQQQLPADTIATNESRESHLDFLFCFGRKLPALRQVWLWKRPKTDVQRVSFMVVEGQMESSLREWCQSRQRQRVSSSRKVNQIKVNLNICTLHVIIMQWNEIFSLNGLEP